MRFWRHSLAATLLALATLVSFSTPSFAAKAPGVGAMLLRAGQMPAGWAALSIPKNESPVSGCISPEKSLPTGGEKAEVGYADAGSLPAVIEALDVYHSSIVKRVDESVTRLDSCHTLVSSFDGERVTFHLARMSFPRVGDQSAAYGITFRVEGIPARIDFAIVRKGEDAMAVAEVDFGTLPLRQFEHFVTLALSDIR